MSETPKPPKNEADRQARQAAALRANLARRKAQIRGRKADANARDTAAEGALSPETIPPDTLEGPSKQ